MELSAILVKWHTMIFGLVPSEDQLRLYQRYPAMRGYSDHQMDVRRCEAVVLLALQAGGGNDLVPILIPPSLEAEMLKQIEAIADTAFKSCRSIPKNAVGYVQGYAKMFKKLRLATRPLQMSQEPSNWLSFGFNSADPLPSWVGNRLLE